MDDDPGLLELVVALLGRPGSYVVETCTMGAEALERAPAWHPDLILLAAMMPGLDGPTTLAMLREIPETAQIPVVLMGASIPAEEVPAFIVMGVVGVIAKPFDPETLCKQVESLWAEAHRRAAASDAGG